MSALGLRIIDESVQQANIWINEVNERTGWDDKQRAYRLLRAVLHALRDHVSPDVAAKLSAQMPIMIRGIFYESWDPSKTPVKERSLAGFLAQVGQDFGPDPLQEPMAEVGAVLDTLDNRISEGEMTRLRKHFGEDVRELFYA